MKLYIGTGTRYVLSVGQKIVSLPPEKKGKEPSCLFSIGTVLQKKLLKGWFHFNLHFSLNIHVVALQRLSFHHLYSSALSHMARVCYSILILSCEMTQKFKSMGANGLVVLLLPMKSIREKKNALGLRYHKPGLKEGDKAHIFTCLLSFWED